jgi:hypothetical protein
MDGKDQYIFLNNNFKNEELEITNLYDINYGILRKITNNILLKLKFLKKLNIYFNNNISNYALKHLHLDTLRLSYNKSINYDAIKHMKLKQLIIGNHTNFNRYWLLDMNLISLRTASQVYISGRSISHMNLHTLDVSYNKIKIKKSVLKKMNLFVVNTLYLHLFDYYDILELNIDYVGTENYFNDYQKWCIKYKL